MRRRPFRGEARRSSAPPAALTRCRSSVAASEVRDASRISGDWPTVCPMREGRPHPPRALVEVETGLPPLSGARNVCPPAPLRVSPRDGHPAFEPGLTSAAARRGDAMPVETVASARCGCRGDETRRHETRRERHPARSRPARAPPEDETSVEETAGHRRSMWGHA